MANIPVTIFSPAERSTLQAVCETLFPSLQPEQGDNPCLFELHAEGLELAAAMEKAISGLDMDQQSQFKQLLRTLEQPLLMAILAGTFKRFSALDQAKKERAVLAAGATDILSLHTKERPKGCWQTGRPPRLTPSAANWVRWQ